MGIKLKERSGTNYKTTIRTYSGGFEMNNDETLKIKKHSMNDYINQANNQNKTSKKQPVVPEFIDSWIQGAKYNGFDLYEAMTDDDMPGRVAIWITANSETFAKAWIFGYDVKKEKLYRAKNRHTDEYLCYCFKFFHDKNSSSEDLRFTAEEKRWKELGYWDNNLYVFEEVEDGEDE